MVLHSPIVRSPFAGRAAVAELYEVLFGALGEIDFTDELADGDTHAFFWRADVGGRRIQGADLVRVDPQGKISEITVLIRPLVDLAVFAGAAGPPLARRRGRIRAAVLTLLTLPLRALLGLADVLATRLVQR